MIRRLGYRFQLKPTAVEAALLQRFIGCSRFVWNEIVALNELRYDRGEKRLGFSAMCEYLVYLKSEHDFLREVHSQPLAAGLVETDSPERLAIGIMSIGHGFFKRVILNRQERLAPMLIESGVESICRATFSPS